jgi:hypothetical protein
MADLVLGPLLRYVGETEATLWVETDEPCEVEVLGHRAPTFAVEDHHYALVTVTGLERGGAATYEVSLDGRRVWPEEDSPFPGSAIRTLDPERPIEFAFGSCRVSAPHVPPHSLSQREDPRGHGVDALYALARRMLVDPSDRWPHLLLLLGDQVYADDLPPGMEDYIASRRNGSEAPANQVADFEEYTRLYWNSWQEPTIRWLMSTVSTAMVFDDHDVHDDWNISRSWVDHMRRFPWWHERITSGFMSYWVYQHIGNLSPTELGEDRLFTIVREGGDVTEELRRFAVEADRSADGKRWSYHRDLGRTRLIVMDSRAGRVLEDGRRQMVDDDEWEWIEQHASGDFDHLLLATTIPLLLSPGMHYLEAASEAICDGAWGRRLTPAAEAVRRAIDLEHWAAFSESFGRVAELLRAVGAGERGRPPASIAVLSGDVHHAYLVEVGFPRGSGVRSQVYQAVCSPFRNPLGKVERTFMRALVSRPAAVVGRALARLAGVPDPPIRWRYAQEPTFDNQVATFELDGRHALLRIEKTLPEDEDEPRLHTSLERQLA